LSFDVALYRNEYEHLIDSVLQPPQFEPGPPFTIIAPRVFENLDGTVAVEGVEAAAEWAATAWLRVEAQGTWQNSELEGVTPGSVDPARMFSLRARIDLPRDVELDLGWRAVSELEGMGVPSYDSVNARAAWLPISSLELSLAVDNLFDDQHVEFRNDLKLAPGTTIGRTVFARVTWQPHR
jgi:iron complex outermembrane receptor protein